MDSSVLIEFVNGNPEAGAILKKLRKFDVNAFINDIVFSEFIFHYLSLKSGKSPLTMKGKGEISEYIDEKDPLEFINQFSILQVDEEVVEKSYDLMKEYSLLPNDAIILATCIKHEVDVLVTLDGDFEEPCKSEGVRVVSKASELEIHDH
ncbi:putative nucleic acid-binding protein, contains PIN domain [Geoglobus ahangari]|uniref:Putative nucleic acid-binding protein, contains PIN domain n=1 Tax=Geoglobus ahangari TaxID=113653 RepID=A0A0F7IDW3_9EURY|nr:type II toxin-antitoxin system VapC family toxin [Geoglobus ahangari]AKG90829.1 putative nucleic acid-binding protein, contains PIN domain [Geoglobus ahangari]